MTGLRRKRDAALKVQVVLEAIRGKMERDWLQKKLNGFPLKRGKGL